MTATDARFPQRQYRWTGTLALLDTPTTDRRQLMRPTDAVLRHRELPLPLLAVPALGADLPDATAAAPAPAADPVTATGLVGTIDQMRIDGTRLAAAGTIDLAALAITRPTWANLLHSGQSVGVALEVDEVEILRKPTSDELDTGLLLNPHPPAEVFPWEIVTGWRVRCATLHASPAWSDATIALTTGA